MRLSLLFLSVLVIAGADSPQIREPETPTVWDASHILRDAGVPESKAADVQARIVLWSRTLHATGDQEVVLQADLAIVAASDATGVKLYSAYRSPRGRGVPVEWSLTTLVGAPFVNQRDFDHDPTPQDIRDFARDARWYVHINDAARIIYAGEDAPPGTPTPPKDWDAEQILREAMLVNFSVGGPRTCQLIRWITTEDGNLTTPNGRRIDTAIIACTHGPKTTLFVAVRWAIGRHDPSPWSRPDVTDMPEDLEEEFDHPPTPLEIDAFARRVTRHARSFGGWVISAGEVPLTAP